MPDFLTKAAKRTEAVRDEGETPLAALFARPCKAGRTKRLGKPGGVLAKMGRLADRTEDDSDPFDRNCVMVLTDRRLLVFGHGTLTGRVRDLIGAVDLVDVTAVELGRSQGSAPVLTISFSDGDSVEMTPGSRSRRFVEAFEGCTAAAG